MAQETVAAFRLDVDAVAVRTASSGGADSRMDLAPGIDARKTDVRRQLKKDRDTDGLGPRNHSDFILFYARVGDQWETVPLVHAPVGPDATASGRPGPSPLTRSTCSRSHGHDPPVRPQGP